eukprot:1656815-Prymnesium_polylepis.1
MGTSFRAPDPRQRELWQMQQHALSVRAQVCLILEVDDKSAAVASRAVVLNRPIASRVDGRLARQLLFGRAAAASADDASSEGVERA